jgi:hypothetical protein
MKTKLELRPATLDDEYRKKWNERKYDFVNLYKNGKKISDTLYRVGGFGVKLEDDYFMLLRHVEVKYDDSITKDEDKKNHLESQWCILDKNGLEKVNFKQFASPYIHGGQIYSLDSKYYNIESGELYCNSYSSMGTDKYLFLDNKYDDDKSKRGVMKIDKVSGNYEIFN